MASEGDVFKNGIGDHCGINVNSIDFGCQAAVTVFVTFHRWFPDIILPQFSRRATEKKWLYIEGNFIGGLDLLQLK